MQDYSLASEEEEMGPWGHVVTLSTEMQTDSIMSLESYGKSCQEGVW